MFKRRLQFDSSRSMKSSAKLQRILDIWASKKGVISVGVFHNIMAEEAMCREASIIDALGTNNLTNMKRGDYYGPPQAWTMRQRKQLGAFLLYKAMKVMLSDGESQLRPNDIL